MKNLLYIGFKKTIKKRDFIGMIEYMEDFMVLLIPSVIMNVFLGEGMLKAEMSDYFQMI